MDGWGWRDLKAFPEAWFDWLAVVLSRVELDGVWPDGLLDAHIAMIPKTGGDATPLGQRPLCLLFIVSGLLFGFVTWMVGFGLGFLFLFSALVVVVGLLMLRYSTALDFEEVLSGLSESHVHVFVADVVKSFDTVDRGILDFFLGKLGLPVWFRKGLIRLPCLMSGSGLNLLVVLVRLELGTGAFIRVAPLCMVFIVALYLPWCGALGVYSCC